MTQCRIILASGPGTGPFPTPEEMLGIVVWLSGAAIALVLFISSMAQFGRNKHTAGIACAVIGCLFLVPILGTVHFGHTFRNTEEVLIYFAIVAAVALVAWLCYVLFHVRRKF